MLVTLEIGWVITVVVGITPISIHTEVSSTVQFVDQNDVSPSVEGWQSDVED